MLKHISADGRELLVSDCGSVFAVTANNLARPLAKFTRKGYEYIAINCGGRRKKFAVHRLVAQAFCRNPYNKPQVNHVDGDTLNNCASNLEWVDGSENQHHSRYVLGNQTGFKDRPVVCVESGDTYISTREAWRKTGVNYCHICECARGKRKTAGGFRWQYVEVD